VSEALAPDHAADPMNALRRRRALRSILRWSFLAIPVLGLVELSAHVWFANRPPSFDAWMQIRDVVRAEKRPGELVVIAPRWADPVARRAFGDELMPMKDEARPDESRYAGALEISILGERSGELSDFREESRRTEGKFLLRHVVNPKPAHVVFDFVDGARPPIADVRGTDPPMTCSWNPHAPVEAGGFGAHPTFPAERFACPSGVFFFVGPTIIADQDFRPRRCLWSHPPARGEMVTRFHGVPLGTSIHGHGGMHWMTERNLTGAPITLTVRVDGDPIGSISHVDGDGWKAFDLPLGSHAGATSADVEFAVTTTNYRDRHFCFEADTRQ
jgi:hypothetical protein